MIPVCKYLSEKLNKKIKLIDKKIFEIDHGSFFNDENDKIIFLENIRFYEEEEQNDEKFAKKLSTFEKFILMMLFLVHIELMHQLIK